RPLVIDPTLVYSTYLGGGADQGNAIALDSSGNVYLTGATSSTNFPTVNAFQSTNPQGLCQPGGPDTTPSPCGVAVVTKLNAAGTALVYSTYLGGSGRDSGASIAVDSSGNAWITGSTGSTNFPVTANAFQSANAANRGNCLFEYDHCTDGFVTKLSAAGNSLVYSTFLGGNSYVNDAASSIAVDSNGNGYVTGATTACDFPTT